jgi:hypothetical protein
MVRHKYSVEDQTQTIPICFLVFVVTIETHAKFHATHRDQRLGSSNKISSEIMLGVIGALTEMCGNDYSLNPDMHQPKEEHG